MIRCLSGDVPLKTLPMIDEGRAEALDKTSAVLNSAPVRSLRFVLDRQGLTIDPQPIVYKELSESLIRLMFPVTGGRIVDGAVVSVVCLYDRTAGRTLYAHPMHAGPSVNPLVRHLDGPMSAPKSQSGDDGNRASRRIIEHKRALWDRFLLERPRLGEQEAGRRWREGYYWALQRLYFCCGCRQCKWGSPFFDGPDPQRSRRAVVGTFDRTGAALGKQHAEPVADIVSSDEWRVETDYARRGGFTVSTHPRLIKALDADFIQVVFPTNAVLLQAGTLVAVSFVWHGPSRRVALSHCLCAGAESEIQFLKGDVAFGLPRPQPGAAGDIARATYRSWREKAWSEFWVNELEHGLAVASESWLLSFWAALDALFGGNDFSQGVRSATLIGEGGASRSLRADRGTAKIPPQAWAHIGGRCFAGHAATNRLAPTLRASGVSTLMVNLGRRCNQACHHCHVDAGPNRTEEMTRETVDDVLDAVRRFNVETVDITGGAPEMNPHFRYLAREASRLGCRVVDRCNLTIFFELGQEDLPLFLAEHGIHVTASLPSDDEATADSQRGVGTFARSIAALRRLNSLGYSRPGTGLTLDLVFNPTGLDLAGSQATLERRYKCVLSDRFGIAFDRLFAMNNMPINRFEHFLRREGQLSEYMTRLVTAFNPDTTDGLMCRRTLSVGYDGRLYDCDFNQVLDRPLAGGLPVHIRDFDPAKLGSRRINTASHCFGCTAGAGSSCNGALVTISAQTQHHHRNGRVRGAQAGGVNV